MQVDNHLTTAQLWIADLGLPQITHGLRAVLVPEICRDSNESERPNDFRLSVGERFGFKFKMNVITSALRAES